MKPLFLQAEVLRYPFGRSQIFTGILIVSAVMAAVLIFSCALAGTDTTFSAATTKITAWSNGSLGKLTAVAGIASALVGLVLKFDWRLVAGAAGIGLTAATGPAIVSALATATF